MDIKIRFNTDKDKLNPELPPWRVVLDGVEHLAEKVIIQAPAWTSVDEIAPGKIKWHITCSGSVTWDEAKKECTISPM